MDNPTPEPTPDPTPLPAPVVETLIGDLPAATGGLTVDGNGHVYVADIGLAPARLGETVYRITPEGGMSVFVSGEGLRGASGNAFDPRGNLFQSNFSAGSVVKIDPDGVVIPFAQGMRGPVGIALDGQNNLYVANCIGRSIQKVTPGGDSSTFATSPFFNCPNGIAADESGFLYVANFSDGRILKVTPTGEVSQLAETPGGNNGHIVYAGNGLFYLADRGAHQIYALTAAGELTLLAGTGERGHDDGPALEATFSLPNGIGLSPDGDILYINEVAPTSGTANQPSLVRLIRLR